MPLPAAHARLLSSISDPATHPALSAALRSGPPRPRLALANAVARAAHASACPRALPAWRLAVLCFRDLAPPLGPADGNAAAPAAPRLAVETYAALYALAVADRAPQPGACDDAARAQAVAADALRAVMAAPASGAPSRRGRGRRPAPEEESVAAEKGGGTEFLDRVVFPGASALGWNRLLPAASGNGAAVVVPALLARIRGADAPLGERTAVARMLLVPWIKFMESATRGKTADARQATAYGRKARACLLHAADGKQHRPADVLQARVAAVLLFTTDPVEFAKTIHRAANAYLRSKKIRDYNTVAEVYCQAMDAFRNILGSDDQALVVVHEAEEVSAWFDHFYVSCFACEDERFRRKAISTASFRSQSLTKSSLFCVVDSQRILVSGGLYGPDTDHWTSVSAAFDAVVENAASLLDDKERTVRQAAAALRFLRAVEPLRAALSSSQAAAHSLGASTRLLQCYVRVFLCAQQCLVSDNALSVECDAALTKRVRAMSAAALSACEMLVQLGAKTCACESMMWPVQMCVSIIVATGTDVKQWAKWLAVLLNNTGIDLYNRHVKCVTALDREMMMQAGWLMEMSAKWLALSSQPDSCIEEAPTEASRFPEVSNTEVLRCSKRLAFAADSFLSAGKECLDDALRAATTGIVCCIASGVTPLPSEISTSFARTAAEYAEEKAGFVNNVLKPLLYGYSLAAAVSIALKAVQKYRVDFYRRLTRSELTRLEPLKREVGLLRLQYELFGCAAPTSSERTIDVDFDFRKARMDVFFGKASGSEIARNLCSRKHVADFISICQKPARRRVARGNGAPRNRRRGAFTTNVNVQTLLAALWDAIERLDCDSIDYPLAQLEERVAGIPRSVEATVCDSCGACRTPTVCELSLFDILETAEWGAFTLARQDMDELAVRLQELCQRTCSALSIPYSNFDVADSYRRLGLTRSCWSILQKDESARYGDCIAVHARVLNDLARYSDTEVVANSVQDARCVGAGADAALLGRGDIRMALARTKAAMKLLVNALAPTPMTGQSDSLSTFQVAGVSVCLSAFRPGLSSLNLAYNRCRISLLIELTQCLTRMAIIYDRVDNVRDAQYYASKSVELSVHLSSPSVEMSCKSLCERIPYVLDNLPSVQSAGDSPCGVLYESDARNTLTSARLLVASLFSRCQDFTWSKSVHSDPANDLLGSIDRAEGGLRRAENTTDVDEDILTPVFAELLLCRAHCLAPGSVVLDSVKTYQLALEIPTLIPERRLEALLGIAKIQLRSGKRTDSLATLETAKCVVSDNRVVSPRLVKQLHQLFATVELSLNPVEIHGVSAVVDGLVEVHGASLALRRSLASLNSICADSSTESLSSLEMQFHSLDVSRSSVSRLRSKMPNRNVVVGLSLSPDKDALLLWQVAAFREPIALRLPIPADGPQSYPNIQQRLNEIIASMKAMTCGEGVLSEREKKGWWKKRFDLDHSLGQLMADIEEKWLGDARALLLPVSFRETTGTDCDPLTTAFCAANAYRPDLISPDAIASVVDRVYPDTDSQCFVNQVKSLLDDMTRAHRILADASRPRQKTQTRHSSKTCGKQSSEASEDPFTVAGELMLAIDTDLEFLPWESLPLLRASKCGVSRLLHESFLSQTSEAIKVDSSRVFYVLNPSGDLASTQGTFQGLFESQYGWNGTSGSSGEKLSVDEILGELQSNDVFLYCGHGGGESILPPRQLARSMKRVPVSILMGCSSGRLERYSSGAESGGTAIEYLLAGAPAVVANMWDVSDRDIDRLTESLLEHWLGVSTDTSSRRSQRGKAGRGESCTLSVALASARDACRLPYLVGAATVVYGNGMIKCND